MYNTDEILIEDSEIYSAETVGMYPDYRQTIKVTYKYGEQILYNALPYCKHKLEFPLSGGIRCKKCGGWYCP